MKHVFVYFQFSSTLVYGITSLIYFKQYISINMYMARGPKRDVMDIISFGE